MYARLWGVREMSAEQQDEYQARCLFQEELDRVFPHGGLCAILDQRDGRFSGIGAVESTGRLFCSGARRSPGNGDWDYEILMDSRNRADLPEHELRVWVQRLTPHPGSPGLWEALVTGGGDERLLRVNTNAPPADRPTPRMRKAVTEAQERQLFPRGIGS